MRLKQKLGRLKRIMDKADLKPLIKHGSTRSLGAVNWIKRMTTIWKNNYIDHMFHLDKDGKPKGIIVDRDDDFHIGGDEWVQAIKGGLDVYIGAVDKIYTKKYTRSATFGWPDVMKTNMPKSLSWYTKSEHFKGLAFYQNIPENELSRSRRYDDKGQVKVVPMSQKGKKYAFQFCDTIDYGLKEAIKLPDLQQFELIKQALPPNTAGGHPKYERQTKDNIVDLAQATKEKVGYISLPKVEGEKIITIKWIIGLIKHMKRKKIYLPFTLYYRGHWDKIRCVFGAFFALKLLGCVLSIAKDFGFKKVALEALGLPMNEDKFDDPDVDKKILSPGNIPYMSQLNWSTQFNIVLDKLPPLNAAKTKVLLVDEKFIFEKFGVELPSGDYNLNCVGEDFKKYDTGLTVEDLWAFTKHKGLKDILEYVILCMQNSKVWYGDMRISDIQYKSGIPFTSILGTFFHQNIIYLYEEWAQKQDDIIDKPIILGAMVQSDDSLIWGINIVLEDIKRMCAEYGLILDPDASVDFQRDHIVTFLQQHCGDIVQGLDRYACVGNPMSRYTKLAHSERKIEEELDDNNFGALVGIWNITGKPVVDAGLSKLASHGPDSELGPFDGPVTTTLKIGKNTPYGRELLTAIKNMRSTDEYELYRPDVQISGDPHWLSSLDVRRIMDDDVVTLATATV